MARISDKPKNPAIEKVIKLFGSQPATADAIGCSQQQVSYMLFAPKVTAEMALKIDAATSGAISKHTLRPDIFGHDATPQEAAAE